MLRTIVFTLACALSLGCQSEPEPTPAPEAHASHREGAPAPKLSGEQRFDKAPPEDDAPQVPPRQPDHEPTPWPPSLEPLYRAGADKVSEALEDLALPLQDLHLGRPFNMTRFRLDPSVVQRKLTSRLVKVEGLSVVERADAPWILKSTLSSTEVGTATQTEVTTTFQLEVVEVERGKVLVSVEAVQVNTR